MFLAGIRILLYTYTFKTVSILLLGDSVVSFSLGLLKIILL